MTETTLQSLYFEAREALKNAGVTNPDLEARAFIRHHAKTADIDLIIRSEEPVTADNAAAVRDGLNRRLQGEPVSRIFGEREFWSLPFKVTPDVLDPRPDSETIIEIAIRHFIGDPPEKVLDLGTGSGCLIVSLLHEWPLASGVGVDICEKALAVAKDNAVANGVSERLKLGKSNWGEIIKGQYDLIVSNPPYISNQELPNLSVEVKNYDPILALDGGDDGLDCYRTLVTETKRLLKPGGLCLFEIGYSQADQVTRLAEDSGLTVKGVHADIAGNPRVVEISFGEK